jgi:hypothetical protein
MNPTFSSSQVLAAIGVATVPSLILAFVFWIRLGPRMVNVEVFKAEATAQLKAIEICLTRLTELQKAAKDIYTSNDTELKASAKILERLTTLQEVSERRLERLESK